ncbi:hypothetical protein AB0I53_28275 [Saccharopolyspora sp. NPDC050389]|uniref:competence protein CoiA family protein n=1 Tax=Saccharopolyspora sp. NPDC050389 TaxID=3155516 RepID=UPI0033DFD103
MTVIAFSNDDHEHELDARRPDFGHPGLFERERFHEDRDLAHPGFHHRRRFAHCIERHRVYLKRNPYYAGRVPEERGFHWVHFPGQRTCSGHAPASPSESQEHKILKARTVVAFRKAGNDPVRQEVTSPGRTYRSDVQFERPDGTCFALEIQVSGIDVPVARRRTAMTRRDGIEPLWMTSRASEEWQEVVPCVRLLRPVRGDRRQDIAEIELFVTGIVYPYWEDCGRGRQCWRRRLHRTETCPGHLRWRTTLHDEKVINTTTSRYEDTAKMLGIDTFAARITSGELVIVHTQRDERGGTFPVVSTPEGRDHAERYSQELTQWRTLARRDRPLPPAIAYCTQSSSSSQPASEDQLAAVRLQPQSPDQSAPETNEKPAHAQGETQPAPSSDTEELHRQTLRSLIPIARALAVERNVFVRVVPNTTTYLAHLQLPGSTLVTGELILIPTNAHRGHLISAGFHSSRLIAAHP